MMWQGATEGDNHHHRRRRAPAHVDGRLHRGNARRFRGFLEQYRRQSAAHALSRPPSRRRLALYGQCPCRRGAVLWRRLRARRVADHCVRPAPTTNRRLYENPSRFNWRSSILYSLETAEPLTPSCTNFSFRACGSGRRQGVAVDTMARPDASHLCLFGTGKQAHTALEAILAVRPIREVRVFEPK